MISSPRLHQERSRRGRLACVRCHAKKVRCDVETLAGSGVKPCTACREIQAECVLRSRKAYFRKSTRVAGSDSMQPRNDRESSQAGSPILRRDQRLGPQAQQVVSIPDNDESDNAPPPRNSLSQALGVAFTAPGTVTTGLESRVPASSRQHQRSTNIEAETPQNTARLKEPNVCTTFNHVYFETYLESVYAWCPVLDEDLLQAHPEFATSTLLINSIAIVGSNLNPPVLRHTPPEEHYQQAVHSFYNRNESNALVAICAVMLFHYWDTSNVDTANNTDSHWWWLGNAIRLAQISGVHRESKAGESQGPLRALRRRIWWTLSISLFSFASSLVPAECIKGKREDDGDDFPSSMRLKGNIFVHYVRLSEICGDVSKLLAGGAVSSPITLPARKHLLEWVQQLPPGLQLKFSGAKIKDFNRDVLLLHIPYLGVVNMLYLNFSANSAPQACIPGIVAASVLARIMEEFLARGNIRFVPEEAAWSMVFAVLALSHARQVECLKIHANADIHILMTAFREMSTMWNSARSFLDGFDKIWLQLDIEPGSISVPASPSGRGCKHSGDGNTDGPLHCPLPTCIRELGEIDGVYWLDYIPYGSCTTTPLLGAILAAARHADQLAALAKPIEFTRDRTELFQNFEDLYGDLVAAE